MSITLKNENDIAHMRVACRLASELLDYITPFVVAGVTTGELDRLCHELVPVPGEPRHAEEQRARNDAAGVVGEPGDLEPAVFRGNAVDQV